MPVNLEIKVKIKTFDQHVKLLKHLGAKQIELLNQKDVYYSHPDGLLKLRIENGQSTLIFYNRDEKKKNRWSEFHLLKFFKDNPSDFFRRVFEIEAIVEKSRRLFLYNNTRIHLDNVKGLGKFLELETLVIKDKKDAEKRFKFLTGYLNLKPSEQFRKSYRNLIIEKQDQK